MLATHFPWCRAWDAELTALFGASVEAKQCLQVLDCDDLLLYWSQLMTEPALAAHVGGRLLHVLVDEYQDTNRLQATILRALKLDGRGVTVMGDDAQAIYSFRAADVRNLPDFTSGYPGPAPTIALERTDRSTQPILAASNAVIALAGERIAKTLWSDRAGAALPQLVTVADDSAQANCVADRMLALPEEGIDLNRQAVLFRTSHHSAAVELELTRRNTRT